MNDTAKSKLTREDKIRLLSQLLMSEPWTLISVGLGDIQGRTLAEQLLKIKKP